MKEWYLTNPKPNITGFESDAITEYAQSNFSDVLETAFSDTVVLYSTDMTESSTVKCVIQGNTADTTLNSMDRTILFPIGTCKAGMYVYFDGGYYIILGCPGNNKSYEKVTVTLCQYKISWQRPDGTIAQRWCSFSDFTKYSSGVDGYKNIFISDNQYGVYIPIDDDTKILHRDMRFVIDFPEVENPEVYKLTNRKILVGDYNSANKGGTTILTMSAHQFNKETDKKIIYNNNQVWICDYFEPKSNSSLVAEDVIINGKTFLKLGYRQGYSVEFKGYDAVPTYEWVVDCDFADNVYVSESTNGIKLQVTDNKYIDKQISLSVVSGSSVLESIDITITGGF